MLSGDFGVPEDLSLSSSESPATMAFRRRPKLRAHPAGFRHPRPTRRGCGWRAWRLARLAAHESERRFGMEQRMGDGGTRTWSPTSPGPPCNLTHVGLS